MTGTLGEALPVMNDPPAEASSIPSSSGNSTPYSDAPSSPLSLEGLKQLARTSRKAKCLSVF